MNNNYNIYNSAKKLAQCFAEQIIELITNSEKDIFNLAISGGNTPNIVFAELSEKYNKSSIWSKTHFWWVDERMVESTNPESNFGTAYKCFFSKIDIQAENIHSVNGANIPEDEVVDYSRQISQNVEQKNLIPQFDLIILGLGGDGHTASIFPNQLHLINSEKICEIAENPYSGQKRITLTGKTINNAANVYFLVSGENKAERVSDILNCKNEYLTFPASYIRPTFGNIRWYFDADAAKLLYP